jgi:hypothetical protein
MKRLLLLFFLIISMVTNRFLYSQNVQIRGWNILSDYFEDDIVTINATASYNINHLQLSHDLVMDLQEVRDPERQKLVNSLIS